MEMYFLWVDHITLFRILYANKIFLQKHAHFIFLSLKSIQNTHRLLSLSLFLSLCHSHTYTQSIHMLSMLHIWIISLIWLFLGFVLTCVTREGWVRTLTQSLRRDDIGKVLNFFPPVCRTRIDPYFLIVASCNLEKTALAVNI